MAWLSGARAIALASVLLGACAEGSDVESTSTSGGGQGGSGPTTSVGGAGGVAPCTPTTWYQDADGDGYGTPMSTLVTCTQPQGYSADPGDCNDALGIANPGATEACNGIDDDCNGTVDDATCAAGCTGVLNPANGHGYVFCSSGLPWTQASAACAGMGMRLARIDDAEENDWVRQQAQAAGAGEVWLGASDAADEGTWIWEDGDQFWDGLFQGGMPVGGLFQAWAFGEPNDDGTEDCTRQQSNETWVDDNCAASRDYACELY